MQENNYHQDQDFNNVSSEDRDSTQPSQTPGFNNQNHKKGKTLLAIVSSLVILLLASGVYFYFFQAPERGLPPTLGGSGLKGFIGIGEYNFATWSPGDKENYETIKKQYNQKGIPITKLSKGVNYLYADEDLSFADILWRINLDEGKTALITYYDPETGKFILYPENNYYNDPLSIDVVENPEKEIIPAQVGFIAIVSEDTFAYGLYTGQRVAADSFVCDSVKVKQGWNFGAVNDNNIYNLLKPCIDDIEAVVGLSGNDFVILYDEDLDDFEKLKNAKSLNYYLVWVYMKDTPEIKIETTEAPSEEPPLEEPTEEPPTDGQTPTEPTTPQIDFSAATFAFLENNLTIGSECEKTIDILIVSPEPTNAADAIISYNPDEIVVSELEGGTVFEMYPGKNIDDKKGQIFLTGFSINSSYQSNEAPDQFGSFKIKAKPGITSTVINFDFDPGNTTDSNISDVGGSTDMLKAVINAELYFAEDGICD